LLPEESLKDLLSSKQILTDKDRVLVCLAVAPVAARTVAHIKALGFKAGWRKIRKHNVSDTLLCAKGLAVRTEAGWELTAAGLTHVATIAGSLLASPIPRAASALRAHLARLTDPNTRAFVEEAVACLEIRQYRAAIVLSWVGAAGLLQAHVFANALALFNTEATRRDAKWRPAKQVDDLSRMKEHDFLDVLEGVSIIGKSVKDELQHALRLRNGCGHPNSLVVQEHVASSHIETLISNVFTRF
jgi:hypothetical protein